MARSPAEKNRVRSNAYPGIDLEQAANMLLGDLQSLDGTRQTRDDLARMLGYSSGSGGVAARKIAGLVHYDFLSLDRRKGCYVLSSFGRYVRELVPEGPEWEAALRAAFQRPVLFKDIVEMHAAAGKLPPDLAETLARDHGIRPKASHDAARIFMASGLYAGVVEPNGVLKVERPPSKVVPVPRVGLPSVRPRDTSVPAGLEETRPTDTHTLTWSFPLPGRPNARMSLELPSNLTEEEFEVLQRNLDFFVEGLRYTYRPSSPPLSFSKARERRKRLAGPAAEPS